jgi:4-amino-4-deoxychorismate lyase
MEPDALRVLALANYGHYTSMQVRNGAVRGLGLHLDRLDRGTRELFGTGLDPRMVRVRLRQAVGTRGALSLRVNVFSRNVGGVDSGASVEPEVLVTASPPAEPSTAPLRVRSVRHERALPHLKHVGTFATIYHGRRARADGFDDALFTDADGRVSEGTIWNVCLFDGARVVWPSEPALPGITMQLLRRALEERGIPSETRETRLPDLPWFRAAFATNSISPAQPIVSVDEVALPSDPELTALLTECYEAIPQEPI